MTIKNSKFYQIFSISDFRNFWIVQICTLLAMQFYFLTLSWLTIDITGSTAILGTLLTLSAIPRLLITPIGGVIFDQVSPKSFLNMTLSVLTVFTMLFTVIIYFFQIQVWMLILFAVFFGITSALFLPVVFALIPKIVPESHLQSANSFSQISMQMSNTIGPALSGILLSLYGATFVYGTMSVLFLISWFFIFLLSKNTKHKETANNKFTFKKVYEDIVGGFKVVYKIKVVMILLIISAILNLSIIGPQQIGLPYIAHGITENGAETLGFLMSSLGMGTLVGVLFVNLLNRFKNKFLLTLIITILLGLFWSLVGIFSDQLTILSALLFMSGMLIGGLNVLIVTVLQLNSPADAMGRIMSLQLLSSTGIQPITFLIVGSILGVISVELLFLFCGAVLIMTALLTLFNQDIRKSIS
ncbi:MFS transporter [Lacicoccus qingdaonensis]|uniref:Predicted arabinose efflux permease, MFS family n=1 Tax=Lacicoccus qingdaonensis TaxID=576118 RepID=A0A1G9JK29_9BACL|nr:MFS transporter [Salinicoccus qingdaonensis]SDL37606.1 Predicted arabinose efflux permease, MFS family [Salinicoccus qingdaonensis]